MVCRTIKKPEDILANRIGLVHHHTAVDPRKGAIHDAVWADGDSVTLVETGPATFDFRIVRGKITLDAPANIKALIK